MLTVKHLLLGALFLLYGLPLSLYASPPPLLSLTDSTSHVDLRLHATMLEDPTGKMTLTDVLNSTDQFYALPTKNIIAEKGNIIADKGLDMGFTSSTFWFRIAINNQSNKEDWYIQHWGGLSRHSALYWSTLPNTKTSSFIIAQPMQHSIAIQYPLHFPRGTTHIVYFNIQDQHAPLPIYLDLYNAPSLMKNIMASYPLFSFIVGGLLTLALYNFLYFLYLRDTGFLYISMFICAFVLEMGNHVGLLNYYAVVRENLHSIGSFFAFIGIASALGLLHNWLNIKNNLPHWHPPLRYVFWMSIGLAFISPWVIYSIAIAGIWASFLVVISTVIAGQFYHKGLRLPLNMTLATAIFIVSMIPALLRGSGLIGDVPVLVEMTFPALLVSLTLLSLTQAEQVRYKQAQVERIATTNKAKDEFLTTMSHELRTPMNAVVNAGHLLTLTPLSAAQNDYVNRLNISSQHMLALINDILDLARIDSQLLPLEKIDFALDKLLKQLELLVIEQARNKSLTLVVDNQFFPLKKQLVGDPTRLQQVLLNLLSNAIKFTEQGEVRLSITPHKVSHRAAELQFEVRDTGIGITTEQQQHLFQPFSQADASTTRRYGGSGLGLAISHQLIQRMGGELQLKSQLGQGSRFFFSLAFPLHDAPKNQGKVATTTSITSSPSSPHKISNMRLLLVDDDEMNRFFGSKMIKTLGVHIETAESGHAALKAIREQHFDGVFMDVSMPDMNGYETTQHIRADARFTNLPVVALTAHAIAGERERCLAAGMDDYITKPFEIKQLEHIIHHWRQRRSNEN